VSEYPYDHRSQECLATASPLAGCHLGRRPTVAAVDVSPTLSGTIRSVPECPGEYHRSEPSTAVIILMTGRGRSVLMVIKMTS